VRDHTSLHAWQEAHETSVAVIRLAKSCWKPYAAALFGQLQRASLSVQLNIAEGYTFGDSPTFTRHLGIAYGSAVETGELLQLAIDAEVIESESIRNVLKRTKRAQRLPFTVHPCHPSIAPENSASSPSIPEIDPTIRCRWRSSSK
jgi:four helix bundle protein